MKQAAPVGIASSVAAADNYDWYKTVEFAEKENLESVQLYLSEDFTERHMDFLAESWEKNICFHLPQNIELYPRLEAFPKSALFIQHEKFVNGELLDFITRGQYQLGLENDSEKDLDSYLIKLKMLNEQGINILAVLDIPRFYHQFYKRYKSAQIFNEIEHIFLYCSAMKIPVIFHIIDSKSFSMARTDWVNLFEGIIPWKIIFNISEDMKIEVKFYLLEYENYDMARDSIKSLKKFINSPD